MFSGYILVYLYINKMEIKIMSNLIFFVAGFVAFKLIRVLRLQLEIYLVRRKIRNRWVNVNYKQRLVYNKNQVI